MWRRTSRRPRRRWSDRADRMFQAGCLHQAVDLIGDVLLRDRLALALAVRGPVDREARHRVTEPVDDRLPDSPVEGQPAYEHDRRVSAAGNGDATSIRPARTSARSPAWISRTKSGMSVNRCCPREPLGQHFGCGAASWPSQLARASPGVAGVLRDGLPVEATAGRPGLERAHRGRAAAIRLVHRVP